jgi:hypothetical protein
MKIIKFTESVNVSESLKYHLVNNKPITENIFRPGSEAFYEVIKEARQLFDLGKVNLCDVDKELYESTDIGKFGMFNGELVPLDLPMESIEELNEDINSFLLTAGAIYSFYKFIKGITGNDWQIGKVPKDYHQLNIYIRDFIKSGGKLEYEENYLNHEFLVNDVTIKINKENNTISWTNLVPGKLLKYKPGKRLEFTDIEVIEHEYTEPIKISQKDIDELIKAIKYDIGDDLNEAKYHDKEVKLNYPMRGGTKKYHVYVKNPKTGKVKKIAFGDVHGGLTAKVSNPKARKAFAARHNCDMKKDKTKAGYWACRINKYGHLWGGKTYPGFW